MKKLTILMAVILIVTLLTGCWLFPESKLDSIEIDTDEITLTVGETYQLKITAFYEDETSADVTSNCDYLSSVSDTEVLTVNDEGLITGVKIGGAIITVIYTQHNLWTGRIIRTAEVDVTVGD